MTTIYREFIDQLEYCDNIANEFKSWLIKNDYPELSLEEIINIIEKERINFKKQRDEAMELILNMDAREFQTKLIDGTLPDFPRAIPGDQDYPNGILRDTCHGHYLLREEDFSRNIINYAEVHRKKIRFMNRKEFMKLCYHDL
jgi:hypothetical protein